MKRFLIDAAITVVLMNVLAEALARWIERINYREEVRQVLQDAESFLTGATADE